jgi:protein-disulfide isomerase
MTRRRFALLAILSFSALAGIAPGSVRAQSPNAEIEAAIRDYLRRNPEELQRAVRDTLVNNPDWLQDVLAELVRKRQAAALNRSGEIAANAAKLLSSPHQVTLGNPEGDVTLVEFLDYNCGYCKRAMADMIALLEEDARLKIVLKEYPVLGPASVEAARVAIAVRMQDADGGKYLAFHKALLGSRGRADAGSAMAAAREAGLDMDRLARDVDSDEVRQSIEESRSLARAIGVTGTPAYVIGNTLVPGAVGVSALRSHIAAVRASRQSAN